MGVSVSFTDICRHESKISCGDQNMAEKCLKSEPFNIIFIFSLQFE